MTIIDIRNRINENEVTIKRTNKKRSYEVKVPDPISSESIIPVYLAVQFLLETLGEDGNAKNGHINCSNNLGSSEEQSELGEILIMIGTEYLRGARSASKKGK